MRQIIFFWLNYIPVCLCYSMSGYLYSRLAVQYGALLLVRCLHFCIMSAWLYDACLPVSDVCLAVWCLLTCMMSAFCNDVCLAVWYLPICITVCLLTCIMSTLLYAVCLPVWCLPTCIISCCLYLLYMSLHSTCTMWCFATCMMPRYRVLSLPTCMTSSYLYFCWLRWLPVFCLLNYMSAYLYYVCLPVFMESGYLYDIILTACSPGAWEALIQIGQQIHKKYFY